MQKKAQISRIEEKNLKMPADIFFMFKIGLSGYEGERKFWNINEKVTDFHIMTRISLEYSKLKENNIDFYLFGTKEKKTRDYFLKNIPDRSPIPLFFVVPIKKKIKVQPNIENFDWSDNPDLFKNMEPTLGINKIPYPLRLGLGKESIAQKKKYFGLVIRNYSLCDAEMAIQAVFANNSQAFKDQGQMSGLLLKPDFNENTPIIYKRVIAKAELIYPYISQLFP